MRMFRPLLLSGLIGAVGVLGVSGCGRTPQAEAPPALPADLATINVETGDTLPGRGWDGVVEAVRSAALAAQTGGRVTVVNVDVNDRVRAGQVLLRITATEQQAGAASARAQLRAAEASAAEAAQTYRRFASLADGQYVSRHQLDQARAARDAANAARDAARAQLAQAAQQADYTVVRAPFDGVIAGRDVEPGETVAPGMPLLRVHAPEQLRIEVALPQSRADAVRRDPRARIVLADGRELIPADVTVFPAADPGSHSVAVRVQLPELADAPAPGTTAKVLFDADAGAASGDAGVRIPAASVLRRGELTGVYVVQDGRLLLRQLRLGASSGEGVDVISGLQAGEVIASDPIAAGRALAQQRQAERRDD